MRWSVRCGTLPPLRRRMYESRRVCVVADGRLARESLTPFASPMRNPIIVPTMTQSLGKGARSAGRDRTAAIMHDIEDYHITPEQAARIANQAGVKHLAFYHLLPAPDGFLPRRLFAQGLSEARQCDWTIADDGSLYTLPLGTAEVRVGRIDD